MTTGTFKIIESGISFIDFKDSINKRINDIVDDRYIIKKVISFSTDKETNQHSAILECEILNHDKEKDNNIEEANKAT